MSAQGWKPTPWTTEDSLLAYLKPMEALNINVGVLGHVDSGKTSLVKALSTVLSTAALDKHPQSRERGITLDLGFSAFTVAAPEHISKNKYTHVQFTLVDCPGHASLIRTIIGGAQIMDMMLLVIDATKGMQAQTLECVVIGEAVMARGADVILVLNKVDLIPKHERDARLRETRRTIEAHLARTKLSNASFVSCAAAVGGEKTTASVPNVAWGGNGRGEDANTCSEQKRAAAGGPEPAKVRNGKSGQGDKRPVSTPQSTEDETATMGVDAVATKLAQRARVPNRKASAFLYFAFDHCFSVRGQGTILTGTVLTGEVKVNQLVELPALGILRRVKSMQIFRQPVSTARHALVSHSVKAAIVQNNGRKAAAGDRVGICVANLDAKLLERGEMTTPGSGRRISSAVALIRKVSAFSGRCRSGANCHVSLGHTTAMATATFFGASELKNEPWRLLGDVDGAEDEGVRWEKMASLPFPFEVEFVQQENLVPQVNEAPSSHARVEGWSFQYCHLAFHTPVIAPPNSVVLGSRLDVTGKFGAGDSETGDDHCRIAFYGRLIPTTFFGDKKPGEGDMAIEFGIKAGQIKLFTEKTKKSIVFRVGDGSAESEVVVFGKDLFKKETNMTPFVGMILTTEHGSMGRIDGAFGKAGRFRARFPAGTSAKAGEMLFLKFRKYLRDPSKQMHQDYLRRALQAKTTAPVYARDSPTTRDSLDAKAHDGQAADSRKGVIESIKREHDSEGIVAIVSGLFSQEEDIRALAKLGVVVRTTSDAQGVLRGPFGKLGKCKVEFSHGVSVESGEDVLAPR